MMTSPLPLSRPIRIVTLVVLAARVTAGCAATRQISGEPEKSGFLGDYSQLKPNPNYPAALV